MRLDIRTAILCYVIASVIDAVVVLLLWLQNRRRFQGLGFMFAAFATQLAAAILLALRGVLPEVVAVLPGNGLF